MKSKISIAALRFPVTVRSGENGVEVIHVVLTKDQLRAAQAVYESSKEVICRIFSRSGYVVLDIGKAERRTLEIDLNELWG